MELSPFLQGFTFSNNACQANHGRDRNPLAKVFNNSRCVLAGPVWLLVSHAEESLREPWNVHPVNKSTAFKEGLVPRQAWSLLYVLNEWSLPLEENTSNLSCQPENRDRDSRKKSMVAIWKGVSPQCDTSDLKDLFRTVPGINGYICSLYFGCRNQPIICQ